MRIGDRIKQKREELGISMEELGLMIGKNRSTIYRYENGDIEKLPTSVLEPIAKALQTTPAHLMGWNDALNVAEPTSDYNVDSKEYKWIARNARKLDDDEQRLLIDLMKKVFNRLEKTEEEDD